MKPWKDYRPHYQQLDVLVTGACIFIFVVSLLAGCSTTGTSKAYVCPRLSAPSPAAIEALRQAGQNDPDTAAYVVKLSAHYKKLDRCNK